MKCDDDAFFVMVIYLLSF